MNEFNTQNNYSGVDNATFGNEATSTVNNGLAFGGAPETLGRYTAKTFGWMFWGLLTTFVTAVLFVNTPLVYMLFRIPAAPFILLIAEVVVVIALSARINKLSVGAARGLFFLYAALNGVTFSTLFLAYDLGTLIFVFALTAVYFGALSAYGYLTKRDLSGLRPILMGGLLFLLAFWVLSMFLPISGLDRIMCIVGLVIFMGYTAYDTQKIKAMYAQVGGNAQLAAKGSIICALQLYLDFINLFLYLLRLLGRKSS